MVGEATYLSYTINTSGLWNYNLIYCSNQPFERAFLRGYPTHSIIYPCSVPGVERGNMQLR